MHRRPPRRDRAARRHQFEPAAELTTSPSRPPGSTVVRPASGSGATIDAPTLATAVGHTPVRLRHRFATDRRLTLPVLQRLGDTVPAAWTRLDDGDVDVLSTRSPRIGTHVGDAIAALATSASTVRLYHLELVADYRELGEAVLDGAMESLARGEALPLTHNTGVFLASPRAVVPAHVDRHHNLLLQIHGTKHVHIGFFPDRARQEREVERHFGFPSLGPTELPPVMLSAELAPGDCVYIPPYAFHWTDAGDGVSVGLSLAWNTPVTDRAVRAYEYNVRLRGLHLHPRPVGTSATRDRAKAALVSAVRRVRR